MRITEQDKIEGANFLSSIASELLVDKNRLSKSIAAFIRNKIEDFHVEFLSDEQMRKLNPLIRNAIFSFLSDYKGDFSSIATLSNEKLCSNYILNNTLPFLRDQNISEIGVKQFETIIYDTVDIPFIDITKGGLMLTAYEWLYVPKYWEDCVYCEKLNTISTN